MILKDLLMRILVILGILLNINLMADLVNDGLKEYQNGNKLKASQLFYKACNLGEKHGCFNLGLQYFNGDGIRQDKSEAKEAFGRACDFGHKDGCENYKILNEQGIQ